MAITPGAGIARVATGVAQTASKRDEIQARAAEVKTSETKATAMGQPDVIAEQVAALRAQNQAIIAKQGQADTYEAFRMYKGTGQVKHLANLVKNNPHVRKKWLNVASIEPLNPEQDARLLQEKGVKPEDFNSFRHLKAVMPNGETHLFDTTAMMGATGYLARQDQEELDKLVKGWKILGKGTGDSPSTMTKQARKYEEHGLGTEAEGFEQLFKAEVAGTLPAKLQMVDKAKEDLDAAFGGDYLSADTSDPKSRVKASKYINTIEQAGKLSLSTKDQADFKDIRDMLDLGVDVEGKLTPEATGMIDNLVRKAELYVKDEVPSVDKVAATSAYAAYRNSVRHALFGSVLTPGEVASFNEAFGSLSQKYPAVVTQFKTSLLQLKSKLEAISTLNDPYVSKYYLGKSQEELAIVLARMDDRLEMLEEYEPGGRYHKQGKKAKVPTFDEPTGTPPAPATVTPTTETPAPAGTEIPKWKGNWGDTSTSTSGRFR